MKPVQIKCELINVRERKDGRMGSSIILKEIGGNNCHEILVDESVDRVQTRLIEQYNGDERHGVFLTRGMTNININTYTDVWDINQEDLKFYTFSKNDVLNLVERIKISEELSEKLINAFSEFTPKEAMLKTKNSKSIQEVLTEKYGEDGYAELTRIKAEEWGRAWRLFEQHCGISTQGDYDELVK